MSKLPLVQQEQNVILGEKVREISDKIWNLSAKYTHNELDDMLLALISAIKEDLMGMVESEKKAPCENGGYGHEHNAFNCGEKLCECCQHIEDGKCTNPLSYEENHTRNKTIDSLLSLLDNHNNQL